MEEPLLEWFLELELERLWFTAVGRPGRRARGQAGGKVSSGTNNYRGARAPLLVRDWLLLSYSWEWFSFRSSRSVWRGEGLEWLAGWLAWSVAVPAIESVGCDVCVRCEHIRLGEGKRKRAGKGCECGSWNGRRGDEFSVMAPGAF